MIVTEQVIKSVNGCAALWLVKEDGKVIGMLEKYPDTKEETHPFKAFSGVGFKSKFLSAYYGRTGREDAIRAIQNALVGVPTVRSF